MLHIYKDGGLNENGQWKTVMYAHSEGQSQCKEIRNSYKEEKHQILENTAMVAE